jgi:hypothetical protein
MRNYGFFRAVFRAGLVRAAFFRFPFRRAGFGFTPSGSFFPPVSRFHSS